MIAIATMKWIVMLCVRIGMVTEDFGGVNICVLTNLVLPSNLSSYQCNYCGKVTVL